MNGKKIPSFGGCRSGIALCSAREKKSVTLAWNLGSHVMLQTADMWAEVEVCTLHNR